MTQQFFNVPFLYLNEPMRADVTVKTYVDNNWGSDVDGNRGIKRTFIDSIYADKVSIDGGPEIDGRPDDMMEAIQVEIEDRV